MANGYIDQVKLASEIKHDDPTIHFRIVLTDEASRERGAQRP